MCSRKKIPQKRSLATPVAVAVECVEKFYARGALCSCPAALCAHQRHLWRPSAHPLQTIELCWSKMMVVMMMCTTSSLYVSFCLCACIRWCVVNGLHPRSTSRQWKYEEIVWALKSCACASRDSSSAIVVSYLKVHFAMVAFKSRRGWYNA